MLLKKIVIEERQKRQLNSNAILMLRSKLEGLEGEVVDVTKRVATDEGTHVLEETTKKVSEELDLCVGFAHDTETTIIEKQQTNVDKEEIIEVVEKRVKIIQEELNDSLRKEVITNSRKASWLKGKLQ